MLLRLASRGAGGLENTRYDHTHASKQTHKDAFSQLICGNADFLCKGHRKQEEVCFYSLLQVQLRPMAHGQDVFCWRPRIHPVFHHASYRFSGHLLKEKKFSCLSLIRKEQKGTCRLSVTSLLLCR